MCLCGLTVIYLNLVTSRSGWLAHIVFVHYLQSAACGSLSSSSLLVMMFSTIL